MSKIQAPLLLLVDDDADIRAFMRAGLEACGFRIKEADTGEQALEICKSAKVDLALLDINLLGMSGIDVAKRLRAETKVPFMFVSGVGDSETVRLAIAQGALGYYLKPLDMQRLVPTIETALVRGADIQRLAEAETHLEQAWQNGHVFSVAVGFVMERFRLRQDEAVMFLQQRALAERIHVDQLARDIVAAVTTLSGHKQL
ncbi:MAG: response regulator [Pseudomonadota bacterium]